MSAIPLFLALIGLFLIAGLAAAIIEKVGQHGPEMARTLVMVIFVAGIGVVVGILGQVVNQVNTTFKVF